ncbi:MAG: nucleoside deaminase [Flavobacteriales bacterium]|jgi:tRNA(adenine34) deaminase
MLDQSDETFMKQALIEAEKAFEAGEVPVGAVIVSKGRVIGRGHNLTERLHDFTAHAEMQAFTAASEFLGGKYLDQCTLYVTLEPCVMCAGAAGWTRVGRIVYGASDEKRGYKRLELHGERITHPRTEVIAGVLADDCAAMLHAFFAARRK